MDIMSYLLQTSANWSGLGEHDSLGCLVLVAESFGAKSANGQPTRQELQPHMAILEAQDQNGWTPLHDAYAYASAPPVLQLIAEKLASLEVETNR